MRDNIQTIRVSLRARCAEAAERLLGTPTVRSRHEWRWGRRGFRGLDIQHLRNERCPPIFTSERAVHRVISADFSGSNPPISPPHA